MLVTRSQITALLFTSLLLACGGLDRASMQAQVDGELSLGVVNFGLTLSPNVILADGVFSGRLTATLTDPGGRPLTGQTVSFAVQDANTRLLPGSTAVTNCQGQARVNVVPNKAGPQVLYAGLRGLRQAKINFTATCPGPLKAPLVWSDAAQKVSTPSTTLHPTAADLNGDGRADVLLPNFDASFSVMIAAAGGTFGVPKVYGLAGAPSDVVAGDFNGDGLADVVANNGSGTIVQLFLNVGDGNLLGPFNTSVDSATRFMAAADFDLDGKLDLAITAQTNSRVNLLPGNGDGTFGVRGL